MRVAAYVPAGGPFIRQGFWPAEPKSAGATLFPRQRPGLLQRLIPVILPRDRPTAGVFIPKEIPPPAGPDDLEAAGIGDGFRAVGDDADGVVFGHFHVQQNVQQFFRRKVTPLKSLSFFVV